MAGQSPWQEHDTACHNACSVRKQRELNAAAQLCLYTVWDPRAREGAARTSGGSSTSVNPIRKIDRRHSRRFVSQMILGPVELAIGTHKVSRKQYEQIQSPNLNDLGDSWQELCLSSLPRLPVLYQGVSSAYSQDKPGQCLQKQGMFCSPACLCTLCQDVDRQRSVW